MPYIEDATIVPSDIVVLRNSDNGCDSIYYKGKHIRDCDGASELDVFRTVQYYTFSQRMSGHTLTPDTVEQVLAEVARQSKILDEAEQLRHEIEEKQRVLAAYKKTYGLK